MWRRASRHGHVDAVHHGGRLEPAAHGRAAVQGDEHPEPQGEVAGADHAGKEARPAPGPVTAGHCAAHEPRRQERHHALTWGAALGAASGAVLGDAIDGVGAGPGAVIGAVLLAPAEAITSIRRGLAELQPLWHRILSSVLLMALFGWLLGLIYGPDEPFLTAIISGALIGLLGLRPLKAALGLLVGAVLGAVFQALDSAPEPALIAAAVTLTYRVIAAIAYRGRALVRVMAEEVPASELHYVVPFEARTRYVGADYVEQLAKVRGGTFRRNHPTSESSPRSTAWMGRPATRAGCTR